MEQQFQFRSAQTSDYNINFKSGQVTCYNELQYKIVSTTDNKTKIYKFKARLEEFKKVGTLQEAKALLQQIMPVTKEVTKFKIGDAKCTIVSNDKVLKITFKSSKEFINFSFI